MLAKFYGMNSLCVYPTKIPETSSALPTSSGDNNLGCNIIHIKPKAMLFDPRVRQLVNESSGVFQELQTSVNDPNKSTDALFYSRKYR